MKSNQGLQQLNNRLDKVRRKLAAAKQRGDKRIEKQFEEELTVTTAQIERLKTQQSGQLSEKGAKLKSLAFNRVLSKAEQADMGKLKKSVRGLVVVHPLTALGREMGVKEVTGFAAKSF